MCPCYGLLCPTGPHMELGPKMCHLRDQWSKKKLIHNDCSIFGILCLEKSFSESAMGF